MEFESSSTAAANSKTRAVQGDATASAQAPLMDVKRVQDHQRRPLGHAGTSPLNPHSTGAKDSTPAAASGSSKKRKTAGASASITRPPPHPATNPAVSRKTASPSALTRETNLMTFTKYKACLNKKGELVADDGTKLAVNGKQHPTSQASCSSRLRCRGSFTRTPLRPN